MLQHLAAAPVQSSSFRRQYPPRTSPSPSNSADVLCSLLSTSPSATGFSWETPWIAAMCRGRRIVVGVDVVPLRLRTETLRKELCSEYSMALFIASSVSSSSSSYPSPRRGRRPPPPLPPPSPPPRPASLPWASEWAWGPTALADDVPVSA